jgi:rubrerythrin
MDNFGGPQLEEDEVGLLMGALKSEVSADDQYRKLLKTTKNEVVRSVISEIWEDEKNHEGKILFLLSELRGKEFDVPLQKGLENKDVNDG